MKIILSAYRRKRISFRLLRAFAAVVLLGILIRCVFAEYLFITSVFPDLSVRLGAAVLALSAAMLLASIKQASPICAKNERTYRAG